MKKEANLYIYASTQHYDCQKAVCISQYYCRQSPVTNKIKTENIGSLLVKAQKSLILTDLGLSSYRTGICYVHYNTQIVYLSLEVENANVAKLICIASN